MKELRTPAVGYIRMSTDKQEDSPARQRGEIERMAAKGSYQILCWYEDHGLTGTESLNRPEFQRLLKDAAAGKFRAVLMYEQSRFSREDALDAMLHWRLFRDAGVKLVTCQRGEIRFDDLAGLITAIVGQHEARGESIRIAQRSLSGRTMRAREGIHTGRVAYGFDREIFDDSGALVRRIGWNEEFTKPLSWKSRLVPTANQEILDGIRCAFEQAAEGRPLQQIAITLNQQGLRTRYGRTFNSGRLHRLLLSPVYAGVLRFGHRPVGKFAQCAEETILVADAHPEIVGLPLFEQVQSALDSAYRGRGKSEPGRYLPSGLLRCLHCGRRLVGAMTFGETHKAGFRRDYRCRTSSDGIKVCSVHPSSEANVLEEMVLRFVREKILSEENRGPLLAAAGSPPERSQSRRAAVGGAAAEDRPWNAEPGARRRGELRRNRQAARRLARPGTKAGGQTSERTGRAGPPVAAGAGGAGESGGDAGQPASGEPGSPGRRSEGVDRRDPCRAGDAFPGAGDFQPGLRHADLSRGTLVGRTDFV